MYEKVPFGPTNLIFLGKGAYSMKIGDDRFGRWFVETPEMTPVNPALCPE
jgi:hypothetical protein